MAENMILLWVSFLFYFFMFSAFTIGNEFEIPENCKNYECVSYKVVQTINHFQIRTYSPANWVSGPTISSAKFDPAANTGFRLLFDYTNGTNDQGVILKLTAPVLVEVLPEGDGKSSFTLYFYIESNYQQAPPLPLSPLVKLVKFPTRPFAAVRRFSGFINETTIPVQISGLKDSLKGTRWGAAAKAPGPYTFAAYNEPFNEKDRVNEAIIWFSI